MTTAATLDEATINKFWKLLSRVDEAGIIDALFEAAPEKKKNADAKTKKSKTKANDDDDTESTDDDEYGNEFGGDNSKYVPRAEAKALVSTDKDGTQPLLYAVQNSFDSRIIVAMIAAGADPNAKRTKGDKQTPLIAACWGEDDDITTALLTHGATITTPDGNGMNALHVCATLGAHNFLGFLLANYVKTADALVSLLSEKEGNNGMTPLQIVIQELPMSLQQNDRRYLLTLEEIFQAMGVVVIDNFPRALAANTRAADDIAAKFVGDNRADVKKVKEEMKKKSAGEEPTTTTGRKKLKTEKNPDIFLTRLQARKVFESKDASGSNVAHTVSEILGTIPQAQPLLRTIFTSFAYATFDPSASGSKLFTQQDAEGNTPLHIMLQHAYLTTSAQAASVATAMVVTTITPAIRSVVASRGHPGNNLVLEQTRNLIVTTRNNEGLSCLGLCAAIAEVPAAASLSAELLALWVSVLPNPLDRRGLFGADKEAYRAFLLGWAISKQNAATQAKATNPEMAQTILNPDAERRINLDMNHCIAKIVGIPNILGTAETLSIFGGLPREAALALRNESIGRAAKLAEDAIKNAEAEAEEEEKNNKAKGSGCCGGASSCGTGNKKGDFSGLGSKGERTKAPEDDADEKGPAEKASEAEIAAVTPGKGLKWAAYGLMCMMLMGIFLPVIEFAFPSTKTAAPTRGKKSNAQKRKKKSSFREEEEEASHPAAAAPANEEDL